MPINEQSLSHLVQDVVAQVAEEVSLEQVKAKAVYRSNIHPCKAFHVAESLPVVPSNPVFQFRCGFLGKRESDDVFRGRSESSPHTKDFHDPRRDHACLSGSRTSNDLEIVVTYFDGLSLRIG